MTAGGGRTVLQVNVAPNDLRVAEHVLPHQLRQARSSVDAVVYTYDLRPGITEFSHLHEPMLDGMSALLRSLALEDPAVAVAEVPYDDAALALVGRTFFGGATPPTTNFRGRPFHSFLHVLASLDAEWVLHLDSDMLLGGGSPTWVEEAKERLLADSRYLVASPLPGPPREDGRVLRQPGAVPAAGGFAIPRFSSRVFLAHLPTFRAALTDLPLMRPPLHGRLWTLRVNNPPYAQPEDIVTARMRRRGLVRLDFAGRHPGLWSLHPPYRSEEFYRRLPDVVRRVEQDDLPDAQRGDYDLNDSVVDMSDARRAIRTHRIKAMLGR